MTYPHQEQDFDLGCNLGDVDESAFEAFPAGKYPLQAVQLELKSTKSANGQMVAAEFEVLEGPFKSRKVFEYLTFQHPNPDTVRIALQKIKQWVKACGYTGNERLTWGLLRSLEGRPFLGQVSVEEDQTGRFPPSNRIRQFLPLGNTAPAAPAQAQAPVSAPPPAAATQPAAQPSPAPVAAVGRSKRPWES